MPSARPRRRAESGPAPARRRGGPAWPALAAAALACVVYLNAVDNPFVYDDRDTVVANPSLADLSNVRFLLLYTPFRPVLNLSYTLDRLVWGTRAAGYHLTNIALHAAAAALLYVFLLRALDDEARRTGRDPAAGTGTASAAAFAAAAVFAVHPLMTESVGYVSGRSEVLSAVWFLGCVLLAQSAALAGAPLTIAGAAAFGLLALATKETAVALPVVLLAFDWLVLPDAPERRRRRLWSIFVPIVVVGLALAVYRLLAFTGAATAEGPGPFGTALTQAIVIWRYIGLLLMPVGQSIMHAVHRVTSPADPLAWSAAAGLLALAVAAFRVRRSRPLVAFGVVWFFAVIAPSSSVIALREGMAEHRAYLAAAGLLMAGASFVRAVLERAAVRKAVWRPAFGWSLAAILIALSALTVARNRVWGSPVSLWAEATVRAEGMWEPHYALADALREANRCDEAIAEYRVVVGMRPRHRDAFTNLGICLGRTGRLDEAETAFRRALEIDPAFARGYTNLGALALVAGDPERARDAYREAIVRDPNNVLARMQLAQLYEQTFHDYHAAARMCGEARLLAPSTPGVVECVERNQRLAGERDKGR